MPATRRHPLTPVAAPTVTSDFYSPQEIDTLFGAVREHAPWKLILAYHFTSTEEYLAVSGAAKGKPDATLADFTAPVFRGWLGKDGVAFYEEVHDIYFSRKLLDPIKRLHGGQYALAHHMMFNICGPAHSYDAGHFDSGNWRGITSANTPLWLMSVMAKSGLFDAWEIKTGQVITYFYDSDIDGGFTYWPDGPDRAPRRLPAPFSNTAILSDNSRMYHRREASGPRDRRDLSALRMDSQLYPDGDAWVVRNGGTEIARYAHRDTRSLFHFTGMVFDDAADVNRFLDHTDDLTTDKVFGVLLADLKTRDIRFTEPTDPMTDRDFIALLTEAYAMAPVEYPAEAPLDVHQAA